MGIDTEEERTTDIVARMWLSLNDSANDDPRWPDVPNTTRCAAMAESGLISK